MRRAIGLLLAATVVALPTAACVRSIDGDPRRVISGSAPAVGFAVVNDECGLLTDETVAAVLGGELDDWWYRGPVCMYRLVDGDNISYATFAWFPSGSLMRERTQAERSGVAVQETVVERHPGFIAAQGDGCAVTAAATDDATVAGVVSWWVGRREADDSCAAAEELLTATLGAAL